MVPVRRADVGHGIVVRCRRSIGERCGGSDGARDQSFDAVVTIGDLELAVDLRARRITAVVSVAAPEDRGGKARCTWLAGQLDADVDRRLVVEAYAKNARSATTATLEQIRGGKDCLLGDDRKDPVRFRLSLTREMGVARKTGRKSEGFIDSVLALITDFYATVVQDLSVWTPKAPKITRLVPSPEPDALAGPGGRWTRRPFGGNFPSTICFALPDTDTAPPRSPKRPTRVAQLPSRMPLEVAGWLDGSS